MREAPSGRIRRRSAEEVFCRAEKVLLSTPKESDQTVESVDIALGQLYVNWSGMLVTRLHFQEAIERADAGLTRVEAFLRSEPNSGVARDTCLKLHGNRSYALIGLERHTESAKEWARVIELAPEPVPPVYRLQFVARVAQDRRAGPRVSPGGAPEAGPGRQQ